MKDKFIILTHINGVQIIIGVSNIAFIRAGVDGCGISLTNSDPAHPILVIESFEIIKAMLDLDQPKKTVKVY